jgi:hypothetical protein
MLEAMNQKAPSGFTWQEAKQLLLAMHMVLPVSGYRTAIENTLAWMQDIEESLEYYYKSHAYPLLAAKVVTCTLDSTMISSWPFYRQIALLFSRQEPQFHYIGDIMHYLHRESQKNIAIPGTVRDLMKNIVDDYDVRQKYSGTDELRAALLNYITVAKESSSAVEQRQSIIQVCCYILGLFH